MSQLEKQKTAKKKSLLRGRLSQSNISNFFGFAEDKKEEVKKPMTKDEQMIEDMRVDFLKKKADKVKKLAKLSKHERQNDSDDGLQFENISSDDC